MPDSKGNVPVPPAPKAPAAAPALHPATASLAAAMAAAPAASKPATAAMAAAPAAAAPPTALSFLPVPPEGPASGAETVETASALVPMPSQMLQYLQKLESWALANERDAKRDAVKLWSLKIPAIVAASVSGIVGSQFGPTVSILVGVIGAICVACDGIVRPGKMRSVHVLALHDLRNLENNVENDWHISVLKHHNSDGVAAKILERAEGRRLKIAEYLRHAEGSAPQDAAKHK